VTIHQVNHILNEQGDLPDDVLLGRIVMFTITDEMVGRNQLEQTFQALNLDPRLLPPEIKPVDAFKKATSDANNKYTLPNGQVCTVLCRDVASTNEFVKRQITREVKDAKARQLSYTRAIECTFYRATTEKKADGSTGTKKGSERVSIKIDQTGLDASEISEVTKIADEIKTRYNRYYHFLDGNKLRATVRDYLKHLNAIELRGGVYFVHVTRSDELSRLQTLVRGWGGGCSMYSIPLVDIERERQMVTDAFQREASQQLTEVAKECAHLRESRKQITPQAYAKIKQRYDEVVSKAIEHQGMLQVSQDLTGAAAEVALHALTDLQEELLK